MDFGLADSTRYHLHRVAMGAVRPNRFNAPSQVRHLVLGEKRFVGKRIGKTLIEIDHDFPDTALLRLKMLSSKFWPIRLLPRQ
ncbi:hypothetical protein [Sinorhizobium meliloti]|uniref:hypothetical protein n=1 Tax=Rhizobium meliloti TaxID=382 RepID=UPI000488541B|nr:hypothetical protein [Sinorhizobium meliloti]